MATRDLIRDIVEAGKASVADPTDRTEMNEAGTASTLVVCYALGEILDELIERVGNLEPRRAGEPRDLGSQLDDMRDPIAKVQKRIRKAKKSKK
jgi:hypothetical protein